MASAAGHRNDNYCNVLDFPLNHDNRVALTVLVNNVRFHITADPNQLNAKSSPDAKVARKFRELVEGANRQEDPAEPQRSEYEVETPEAANSQDSGHGTDEEYNSDDADSAVDVNGSDVVEENPARALKYWMLSPFESIFDDHASAKDGKHKWTVQEWYEPPTRFYSLAIKDGNLTAKEEKSTSDLKERMKTLLPVLPMPKYIRNLGIPWYPASEATVLSESDDPGPYHPSRVSINGKVYFLKVVDPTQPSPTVRELKLLKRIERLGLHKKMNVPRVEGLLGSGRSSVGIVGFLQTDIEDPRPLTKMLDEDVPQKKRDKWAKESDRVVDLLHENGVVWGDAKADNFMVDKHDELWIIDFGGSYTEGWVSPSLMETEEGDDMGVERIVNALHDPVANTCDPGVHQVDDNDRKASQGKKRKANEDDGTNADADREPRAKRARKDSASKSDPKEKSESLHEEGEDQDVNSTDNDSSDRDEQDYLCICNQPDSSDMVACDGEECPHQWFHFSCIGLKQAPKEKHWYCRDCKAK